MANIIDADDAIMYAKYSVDDWFSEFQAHWHEPETVMVEAMWKKLTPEQKKTLMQSAGEELQQMLGGFENG